MPAPTYDYLIVGAGSAGATLAARLTEGGGARVLLVEAGPDWRSADAPAAMRVANPHSIIVEPEYAHFRWDALKSRRTAAQPMRTYWRGRGLGGSSVVNGQIAIRGVPEDYDGWAAEGCTGWGYADILPAFNRLETDLRFGERPYHGDTGPIPIYRAPASKWGAVDTALAEAALDLGHPWAPDHNAPGTTGVSPYAINSLDGARVTTNDAYLEGARGRNTLSILGDALVERVLFDDAGRTVGVRLKEGGAWRDVFAGEVILSAGAVHSPPILMRSGLGPGDHLRDLDIDVRADLPVGMSFQDHPAIFAPIVLEDFAVPPQGFRHTNLCVRYASELEGAGPNDMMMVAMNRFGDSLGRHVEGPKATPEFGLLGVWVNECRSRGNVRLASADPAEQPIVEENMLSDASDLSRLRDGFRRLLAAVRQPAIAAIGKLHSNHPDEADDAALDAWLVANAGDTQHATSTCRMGDPAAATTVVDPACRVLGVEGLRVIDASVMPAVPRANTHLTTVMIAEAMAERIRAGG